ncbi:PP-loop family protein [Teratosphaeria destructans]|uniref:tRNA(Ile)-lysidine synthetase n=1 Tax=Teratosphaeria destructans TaxID=418781 RepID=A0A9W7T1A1_9PEZI|nr:PP-loop family protein [Teratosphaeria destructans]
MSLAIIALQDRVERSLVLDHRLRERSSEEALNVKLELHKSQIEASILTLDWSRYRDLAKLEHLETLARNLRYHAIAKACTQRSIRTLLLAHHADDQAETVLSRMVNGYHGSGLRGIRTEAPLPISADLCGPEHGDKNVKSSSEPTAPCLVPLASPSGITALRPLLPFRKQELIDFCQSHRLPWFEDHTNADPTFTMRNTIRHLQKQEALPQALQTQRLLQVAEKRLRADTSLENRADAVFKNIPLSLNTATGEVTIIGALRQLDAPAENAEDYRLQLLVMRRLAMLVAPEANIELSDLANALHLLHSRSEDNARHEGSLSNLDGYQVVGVHFSHKMDKKSKRPHLRLRRANPTQSEKKQKRLTLTSTAESVRPFSKESQGAVSLIRQSSFRPKWDSGWRLWDERYWIRVYSNIKTLPQDQDMTVRFLTPELLGQLRIALNRSQQRRLTYTLDHAPGAARFTLPAIAIESGSSDPEAGNSTLEVALPSLGWRPQGWLSAHQDIDESRRKSPSWMCEIKYKHVDIGKKHEVVHRLEPWSPADLKRAVKASRPEKKDIGSRGGHGQNDSAYALAMGS